VLARIALDQPGEIVHRERRRVVHLMFEADRLVTPQFGMRLVPFAEDLARRHCRAPPGFLSSVGSVTTIPGRFFQRCPENILPSPRGIVSCPDMRRLVDLHLLFGKKGAARQAKPLAGK
jgi:hypothetical protein